MASDRGGTVPVVLQGSLFDDTVHLGQGNAGSDCGLRSSEGFRLKPRRVSLPESPAFSRRRHDNLATVESR